MLKPVDLVNLYNKITAVVFIRLIITVWVSITGPVIRNTIPLQMALEHLSRTSLLNS